MHLLRVKWSRQKGIKKKWLSLKYAFMLKQNEK